jgi:MbtH protein
MGNPFDAEDGSFLVLVNDEFQYCLWPDFIEVPAGWQATGPKGDRKTCLDWIEKNWTDMRPASLVRHMQSSTSQSEPPNMDRATPLTGNG